MRPQWLTMPKVESRIPAPTKTDCQPAFQHLLGSSREDVGESVALFAKPLESFKNFSRVAPNVFVKNCSIFL